MADRIVIWLAVEGDSEFVAGLVSSLLEFGSPAWEDTAALVPGFRDTLTGAVRVEDPRAAVLIAQAVDGTPLGFISLKVGRTSRASSEVTWPIWPSSSTRAGGASARP